MKTILSCTLLLIGLVNIILGCKDKTGNVVTETFVAHGDTIKTRSTVSDSPLDANYQLDNLTPELQTHIANALKHADTLIQKYTDQRTTFKYDANVLDEVMDKWRQSKAKEKETPEYVVETLGAAFGQDIIYSLNCEWQILTDQNGSDLTVIHKKYKVNGFPFSTAERAYTQNKSGSFQTTKSTLEHEIEKAKKGGEVQERN